MYEECILAMQCFFQCTVWTGQTGKRLDNCVLLLVMLLLKVHKSQSTTTTTTTTLSGLVSPSVDSRGRLCMPPNLCPPNWWMRVVHTSSVLVLPFTSFSFRQTIDADSVINYNNSPSETPKATSAVVAAAAVENVLIYLTHWLTNAKANEGV